MASELLGMGVCPMASCGQPIKVNKAKTGNACYACSACKSQHFARSRKASADLLELTQCKLDGENPYTDKPQEKPEEIPKPEPVKKPAPVVVDDDDFL